MANMEFSANCDSSFEQSEIPVVSLVAPLTKSVVKAKFGSYLTNSLIDTGASISCISENFLKLAFPYEKVGISNFPHIKGVGGEIQIVLGSVMLDFFIEDTKFSQAFHVLPRLPSSVILGENFLQENDVVLDFSCNAMIISDSSSDKQYVNFIANSVQEICGLARTKEEICIPPNSEIQFKVRLPKMKNDSLVIIEPIESLTRHHGVAGGRSLSKVSNNAGIFRLLNPSQEEQIIPKDTVVGKFSLIDESFIFDIDNKQPYIATVNTDNDQTDYVKIAHDLGFDLSKSQLTTDQRQKLLTFLGQHRDIFSTDLSDLGKTDLHHHVIDTGDTQPVKSRPFRQSPQHQKATEELLQDFLKNDLIEESNSMYSSPIILVKKRDQSFRFVCDYRKLNAVTVPMSWPLPVFDDVIDSIGNAKAKIFTTLDLANGFFQIPLHEDSKHKTAFVTHQGLYQFKRLPQGLSNSPLCFQQLMSKILRKLLWKIVLIYIDDLILYSQTFEEHLEHLNLVFAQLRQAKLTLKPSKCNFATDQVHYLGHVLSSGGVQVDKAKVEAIKSFPVPKSQKQVRSFLGLTNFYRKYVNGYAKLALPLNALLQKPIEAEGGKKPKFQWSPECEQAFNTLKDAMCSTPVLVYPNFNKEFFLATDASDLSIGFVLSQRDEQNKEHPIAYGGRALHGSEKNWSITEKEGLALVEAIRSFRPYLANSKFTVYTDHIALKWLKSIKDATGRLGRWSLDLSTYNFEIIHRSGKANGNADALSRREYDKNINCNSQTEEDSEKTVFSVQSGNSSTSSQNHATTVPKSSVSLQTSSDDSIHHSVSQTQDNQTTDVSHIHPDTEATHWSVTFEYDEDYTSVPVNVIAAIHASDVDVPQDKMVEVSIETHPNLRHLQRVCPDFSQLLDYKEDNILPDEEKERHKVLVESDKFEIDEGILYRFVPQRQKGHTDKFIKQLAVPRTLRKNVLYAYHDSEIGGCHNGKERMHNTMRPKYYWPRMYNDVATYVQTCEVCQQTKRHYHGKKAPLCPLPVEEIFTRWHIDILGPLPTTADKYKYILVVTDAGSRWVESFPLRTQEAQEVADILVREIYCRYGSPRTLISDRGQNFMSKLIKAICELLNIKFKHTSPYHPQTNSCVERLNSYINQSLRAYCNKSQNDWPRLLPGIMMAYRMAPNSSNQKSPFLMLFGREMRAPQDVALIPKENLGKNHRSYLSNLLQELEITRTIAAENNARAKEVYSEQYNRNTKLPTFSPGQRVWLYCQKVQKGFSSKLTKKWYGSYYIVHTGPNYTYKLRRSSDDKIHKPLVHANRLKPYFDPADRPQYPPEPLINNDEDLDSDVINENEDTQAVPTQTSNTKSSSSETMQASSSSGVTQASSLKKPSTHKKQAEQPTIDKQKVINDQNGDTRTHSTSTKKKQRHKGAKTNSSNSSAQQPKAQQEDNANRDRNQPSKEKAKEKAKETTAKDQQAHHQQKPKKQTQKDEPSTGVKTPKAFRVEDIHSIITSKRANGKLYYKIKWNDDVKGTTWEYDTTIPEVLRREFHVKKSMSGKKRKKPLRHHQFFTNSNQSAQPPSVNYTKPGTTTPCAELQVTPIPPKNRHLRKIDPNIIQIWGIEIVDNDCHVEVSFNNPMNNKHIVYLECVPLPLMIEYLRNSWSDLLDHTNGKLPQHYDIFFDPGEFPVYASKNADYQTYGDIMHYKRIQPNWEDTPYSYQPAYYLCTRQVEVFLQKIHRLLQVIHNIQ